MNKAEDKKLLSKTIEGLPDSYARDILTDLMPEMFQAIDNDFGYIPFALRVQQSQEDATNHVECITRLSAMKREISELESKKSQLQAAINDIRSKIQAYARL